jgi:hypothetical protein
MQQQSVRVRASELAAQRRAKAIRDATNGAAGGPLGDPPELERSGLFEYLTREPPRPRGRIPVHPSTDGAAILRRVLGEPVNGTPEAAGRKADPASYERDRKRRWRAARRAAGLPGAHGRQSRRGVAR